MPDLHGAQQVGVVVLERRDARYAPGRVDGLARADGSQRGPRHAEPKTYLVDGGAGQRDDLDLQAGQLEAFVVAQHPCDRDRLDGGEVIPVVDVHEVRLASAKVLERVAEELRLALRHEDAKPELSGGTRRACAMVSEEVSAGHRYWPGRQLGDVVDPFSGSGIDDQDTVGTGDGVDIAAVGPHQDTRQDLLPLSHASTSPT